MSSPLRYKIHAGSERFRAALAGRSLARNHPRPSSPAKSCGWPTRCLPWLLALLAPTVTADEVRLKSGARVVGTTRTVGDILIIKTRDGEVRVPLDQVERLRTTAELRAELARLTSASGRTAFGQFELARLARDWGLDKELWLHLNTCLGTKRSPALRDRLRNFMAELEPIVLPKKWRSKSTGVRVRELLFRLRRSGPNPALESTIAELLAREPEANKTLRLQARSASIERQRLVALHALSRRQDDSNDDFVYRSLIFDRSQKLRHDVASWLADEGRTDPAIAYLAPGLLHRDPRVRVRIAEAYGNMNDGSAIPILVESGSAAASVALPGGSTRAHIAVLQQTSYVRDFDVEVAQGAFIANPQVDVLTSGVVLDVTVHSVISYRTVIIDAMHAALKKLARSDPGKAPKNWAAWWRRLDKERKISPPETKRRDRRG